MKPHKINTLNNFMAAWYIKPDVCDKLIDFYEAHPNKEKGSISKGESRGVDLSYKNCMEVYLEVENIELQPYLSELIKVTEKYKKKYIYCDKQQAAWSFERVIKIQKYLPKEAYFSWHYERVGDSQTNKRNLVFTTYLNDVKDKGETDFYYQKLKIQPRKGLTLIFPAEWTHTHRGLTSTKDTKYIITGWYGYFK